VRPDSKKQLLDEGFERLVAVLRKGRGLVLKKSLIDSRADADNDVFWQIEDDAGSPVATILVRARSRFTPRTADEMKARYSPAILKRMGQPTVLLLTSWLSPRSRQLIEDEGWSYLDLSGNVLLRSADPLIYVRLDGAATDPEPRARDEVLLRGTSINGLLRLLVDVEPPYRLSELATVADLSMGYLSRVLKTLHETGLIERAGSGPVVQVRWPELLRRRASEYDLLKSNRSGAFLARSGPRALLAKIADRRDEVIVTGSFAAAQINQVAVPVQLSLYVPSIRAFAEQHGLIPTQTGANVLLLEAASPSQLARSRLIEGAHHAGYSQLVQDLLAGNGRLPEEGEAVLEWMIDTPGWRLPSLLSNLH